MRGLAGAIALVGLTAWLAAGAAVAAPAGTATTPWAELRIPAIGLDVAVYSGDAGLAYGPSHDTWTGAPGGGRTIGIAGHRVTHTHPFRHLDEVRKNDVIELRHAGKLACYRVTSLQVVSPYDLSITGDRGWERLVLTTCTPPGYATYRLVVIALRQPRC